MARVLGVSALYHDAAAALVVDGTIAAAMQQERFSRVKNDASLPIEAAEACLRLAGVEARDLDALVFYEEPFKKLERVLTWLLRSFPRSYRQFGRALRAQLSEKLWVLDSLSEALDVPRARVHAISHHRSHAASAFFTSPFERAAVLTVDGVGEDVTTGLLLGEGNRLTSLASSSFPHSLGLLYAAFTAYLGFEVLEGEYKVMGLAAYGKPRFRDEFSRVVRLLDGGGFELNSEFFDYFNDPELGFGPKLEQLFGPRRPYGQPWSLEQPGDRRYADIAASLQSTLEDALLGLARRARRDTGADCLCLAGGVALNASANRRLLAEAGFDRVYVQPAAGDAGGALGAAIDHSIALGDPRPVALASAALGSPVVAAEAQRLAEGLGLRWRRLSEPPRQLAELLASDKIVAFASGRFEWGPRALGQRSILARADSLPIRERLNRAIKQREPFRPFAPAVTVEAAAALLEFAPNDMTPFMTTTCPVRESARAALAGVTHEDGTARAQTVSAEAAPQFHALLSSVAGELPVPALLNTSLNGAGEPIAASAADALTFFAGHAIDALLVEDVLVEKK